MADIFISYTHKDNARLSDEQFGWIDRFHEALTVRLTQLRGRETEVWRDLKIEGSDLLTPTIEAAIADSAILVSVLSPGYLQSEWCDKELKLFCEAAAKGGGLRIGTKSRVVKVIKMPVGREFEAKETPEFADSIGYDFYSRNERGVPTEFDPRSGPEARQEFLSRINELAYHLRKMLDPKRDAVGSADVAPATGLKVYVAETSFDLAADADRLRRELQQFGHTVLPAGPLPYNEDYCARVRKELEQAILSIHLIGPAVYGIIPEASEASILELQYRLAGEETTRRKEMRRLVWLPLGVPKDTKEISDRRQAAFIDSLRNDPQLLVSTLEQLKTTAAEILTPTAHDVAPPPRSSELRKLVYLLHDASDAAATGPVEDALFAQEYEVIRPMSGGDEREKRQDHETNLRDCDAVLLYCGEATEFWLRVKVRDLQKIFGYGRTHRFSASAVFFADPKRADKEHFRSHELAVISGYGPFEPSLLDGFLATIENAKGEAV